MLGQSVITEAINPFTYTPSTLPFDGTGPVWTYSVTYQSGNPTYVSTVSGTNILVGSVTNYNAGSTSGTITSSGKVGSAVY